LPLALVGIVVAVVWFQRLRIGTLARNEAKWAYLCASPWLIGFLALTFGPMLASLFFSFTLYDDLYDAHWIGLRNYGDMFGADRDRQFFPGIRGSGHDRSQRRRANQPQSSTSGHRSTVAHCSASFLD